MSQGSVRHGCNTCSFCTCRSHPPSMTSLWSGSKVHHSIRTSERIDRCAANRETVENVGRPRLERANNDIKLALHILLLFSTCWSGRALLEQGAGHWISLRRWRQRRLRFFFCPLFSSLSVRYAASLCGHEDAPLTCHYRIGNTWLTRWYVRTLNLRRKCRVPFFLFPGRFDGMLLGRCQLGTRCINITYDGCSLWRLWCKSRNKIK